MIRRLLAPALLFCGTASLLTAGDLDDLRHPDPKVRAKAAGRLTTAKGVDPALVGPLADLLRDDPDPYVRRMAAYALGNFQPPPKLALAALVEAVTDADEPVGVRLGAADALGRVGRGSKRVRDALAKAADEPGWRPGRSSTWWGSGSGTRP